MDEKKYIDASPVMLDLTAMKREYDAISLDGIIKALKEAPAADVVEVRHARWITEENTEGYRGDPHCTACKGILDDEAVYGHTPGEDSFFYCPNCGAKMDGGKMAEKHCKLCEDCIHHGTCFREGNKKAYNGDLDISGCEYCKSAVNFVEVVHAEWKCVADDDQYDGEYYCSACSAEQYIPDNAIFPPFCWHCGAKMDGERYAKKTD